MQHTLLIPTYNRPRDLARLLRFLAGGPAGRQAALRSRILVGDSSRPEHRAANRAAVAAVADRLDIDLQAHPQEMPAFVKYRALVDAATTGTVSFCADDDLVVPEALAAAIADLAATAGDGRVAVQGRAFYLAERPDGLALESAAYWRDDLAAADRWDRLEALFASYEAPFYAVYRCPALQAAFAGMPADADPLWQELWLSVTAIAAGPVGRRADWAYGRFVVDLPGFSNWHPHEILARSPMRLLEGMRRFRDAVLPAILGPGHDPALDARFDLLLLRYLGGFLTSGAVDDLIAAHRDGGAADGAALAAVWKKWARGADRARGRHLRPWQAGRQAALRRRAVGLGRRALRRLARDPAMPVATDERVALPLTGAWLTLGQEFLMPSGTGAPAPDDAETGALVATLDRYWACDAAVAGRQE
ncbi:MAG: TIGR00180 family glycosyltransferase [Sneathiellaceae bacterium]